MKKRIIVLLTLIFIISSNTFAYADNSDINMSFTTEIYSKEWIPYTPPVEQPIKVQKPATPTSITVTKNTMTVIVNGKNVTADNFLYDGTTYLPLRAVSESLGATVDYDSVTKTATITTLQNAPVSVQPAKDIQMSNYLIASVYASEMVKNMLLIMDCTATLPDEATERELANLESYIKDLRNSIDFVNQNGLYPIYDISIYARNVADNADECLKLVKKGTPEIGFESLYREYYSSIEFCALGGLKKLNIFNTTALDYALNK